MDSAAMEVPRVRYADRPHGRGRQTHKYVRAAEASARCLHQRDNRRDGREQGRRGVEILRAKPWRGLLDLHARARAHPVGVGPPIGPLGSRGLRQGYFASTGLAADAIAFPLASLRAALIRETVALRF